MVSRILPEKIDVKAFINHKSLYKTIHITTTKIKNSNSEHWLQSVLTKICLT